MIRLLNQAAGACRPGKVWGVGMGNKTEFATEVVGASIASKVTQSSAVVGTVGFLADINWIGLSGVAIAILGLLANLYFQARREKLEAVERQSREVREQARERREQAEHEARMRAYQAER